MNDIIERIGKLLTTRFGVSPEDFSAEVELETLDMDSLAIAEFEVVAEKEFGVKFEVKELSPYDTVADVANLIASKAAGKATA